MRNILQKTIFIRFHLLRLRLRTAILFRVIYGAVKIRSVGLNYIRGMPLQMK